MTIFGPVLSLHHVHGSNWCMFAEDGDKLYSDHHVILTSNFSARTGLL